MVINIQVARLRFTNNGKVKRSSFQQRGGPKATTWIAGCTARTGSAQRDTWRAAAVILLSEEEGACSGLSV